MARNRSTVSVSPAFLARSKKGERQLKNTLRRVEKTKDPSKKMGILWDLAFVAFRDLEDFRPGGGFR